jgi:uncharacterized glyoxalase superfamily protein PhnB
MSPVKAIPEGYHSIQPYLHVRGATAAMEFYKQAFGATEIMRMQQPDGRLGHAEIRIGDSVVMLADEFPEYGSLSPQSTGGTGMGLHIYTEDVDAAFDRAVKAGAKVDMPVSDMFWGDRYGKLSDPFGHKWSIATHKRDMSLEEMEEEQNKFMKDMPKSA